MIDSEIVEFRREAHVAWRGLKIAVDRVAIPIDVRFRSL